MQHNVKYFGNWSEGDPCPKCKQFRKGYGPPVRHTYDGQTSMIQSVLCFDCGYVFIISFKD